MRKQLDRAADRFNRLYDSVMGISAKITVDITNVTHDLSGILEKVEPHFIQLGQLFPEAQNATGLFIRDVVLAMEAIRGGEGQTGLSGVKDLSAEFVNRLDTHRNAIVQSVEVFDHVIRELGRLAQICGKADRVALLLRVIALNIGIESQGLGDAGNLFKAFVEEINLLSDHMKAVAERLGRDARVLVKKHAGTMEDIKTHLAKLEGLAKVARKDMAVSSKHVHCLMETAMDSMQAVKDAMRHIKKKSGDIVVALQFHDIIRQKIEHMASALSDTSRMLRTGHAGGPDKHQALRMLMIQSAQIEEIKKEIRGAREDISNALQAIDEDVGHIYRHIASQGLRQGRDSVDDPFHVLMGAMTSLAQIRTQALDLGARVHKHMEETSNAASSLTVHLDAVGQIRLDLHRKALNAIIKAAHLGDAGKGIEVFAQEVNHASQETQAFADQFVSVVNGVRENTGRNHLKGLNGDETSMDRDRFARGQESLSRSYEDFVGHIESMTTRFAGIEDVMNRGRNALGFLDDFEQGMDLVKEAIHRISERIGTNGRAAGEGMASIPGMDRYTMESERLIHDRTLGFIENAEPAGTIPELLEDATETQASDGPGEDDPDNPRENDFGDNVELF